MKTEIECELFARETVKEYINGCECDTSEDALNALHKLIAVSVDTVDVVSNGVMATSQ